MKTTNGKDFREKLRFWVQTDNRKIARIRQGSTHVMLVSHHLRDSANRSGQEVYLGFNTTLACTYQTRYPTYWKRQDEGNTVGLRLRFQNLGTFGQLAGFLGFVESIRWYSGCVCCFFKCSMFLFFLSNYTSYFPITPSHDPNNKNENLCKNPFSFT